MKNAYCCAYKVPSKVSINNDCISVERAETFPSGVALAAALSRFTATESDFQSAAMDRSDKACILYQNLGLGKMSNFKRSTLTENNYQCLDSDLSKL